MGFFVNGEPDNCDGDDCCPTSRMEAMMRRTAEAQRQAEAKAKNDSKK